jgi:CubicO group peptidase (beta-lactamase class C family)
MSHKFLKSLLATTLVVCVVYSDPISPAAATQTPRSGNGGFIDYTTAIDGLKQSLPETMAKAKAPGVAAALVDGDRLVWAEGFGFTDNSRKMQVTADTLFSVQSISKSYTATAFMKTVERGWFKLDDRLKTHLPEFNRPEPLRK